MARIYHRAALAIHQLGRADGFGKRPVCCGRFDVSDEVRVRIGLDHYAAWSSLSGKRRIV